VDKGRDETGLIDLKKTEKKMSNATVIFFPKMTVALLISYLRVNCILADGTIFTKNGPVNVRTKFEKIIGEWMK